MSWIAAGVASAALTKNLLIDKPKQTRAEHNAAVTMRYSPWTHAQPGPVKEAQDPMSATLQGGAAGMGIAQGIGAANQGQDTNAMMAEYYGNQADPSVTDEEMQLRGVGPERAPKFMNPWARARG